MDARPHAGRWPLAVVTGLFGLAAVRFRDRVPFWVDLHVWLREQGVPQPLRHLDAPLLLLAASLLGARLAAGHGRALHALGLRARMRAGLAFGLLAAVPMWVQAVLASDGLQFGWMLLSWAVAMPLAEEVLFRGVLVAVPVTLGGCRFWPAAILAGLLFGSLHVPWSQQLAASDLPVFAITAVGGVWYAWLCRAFDWNLWATIGLHAAMNAAWLVTGVADDAAGGLWPNVGRGATIALGTVLALRHRRRAAVG